jgi:hypothetical protein
MICMSQSSGTPTDYNVQRAGRDYRKGSIYYASYGTEIVFMLLSGFTAIASTLRRTDLSNLRISYGALAASAVLMSYQGYTNADVFSVKIAAMTGPLPLVISALVFVSADATNWRAIARLLRVGAGVLSLCVLVNIAYLQSASRTEALTQLLFYLNALYWPAVWLFLEDTSIGIRRIPCLLPLIVYGVGGIVVQTRLCFIMIACALILRAYRHGTGRAVAMMFVGASCVVMLLTSSGLNSTGKISTAWEGLSERSLEDTRTGQLEQFFDDVGLKELVVGRGSFATWTWNGVAWDGGTDVGYLSLALFGGVPLLLSYVMFHFSPIIWRANRRRKGFSSSCDLIVVLWAVRMFSSSYPSLSMEYYYLLLCIGGCFARSTKPSPSCSHLAPQLQRLRCDRTALSFALPINRQIQ